MRFGVGEKPPAAVNAAVRPPGRGGAKRNLGGGGAGGWGRGGRSLAFLPHRRAPCFFPAGSAGGSAVLFSRPECAVC